MYVQLNKHARKYGESLRQYFPERILRKNKLLMLLMRSIKNASTPVTTLFTTKIIDELESLLNKYEQVRTIAVAMRKVVKSWLVKKDRFKPTVVETARMDKIHSFNC